MNSSTSPAPRIATAAQSSSLVKQRGSAIFELPLVVGLILIPFGLLVLLLPTWVERQTAARDAASELARSLVVADSVVDASAFLREIEAGHGLDPGSLQLVDVSDGDPGELVTVWVSVVLPGQSMPLLGVIVPRSWTAEHSERRPDYGLVNG